MSAFADSQVPFPESCALNTEHLTPLQDSTKHNLSSSPADEAQHISYVPGDPTVSLQRADVIAHLSTQLETRLLDELHDRLWLVARKSGQSIDALHVQCIKGRIIVPSEDPRLHLVWLRDKIYIKPLPIYLLNYEFWAQYLRLPESTGIHSTNSQKASESTIGGFDRSVAVGFLRSYAFLIQHYLDFAMAKESHLIPNDVDWIKWSKFIKNFRFVRDDQVAKRYHYGQLRLSRLNWVVRLFHPKHASTVWFYEIPHWSISDYVTQATIPLLFLFASLSLALSSMQVALAVPADGLWFQQPDMSGLRHINQAFWVFSVGIVLLSGVIWVLLLGIPLIILAWQLSWGFLSRGKQVSATRDASV